MEKQKEQTEIVSKTFVLSVNPRHLQLINEQKFSELRDFWHDRLERLEKDRLAVLKLNQHDLYEKIWMEWHEALQKFDRFYVLADLKMKGKLSKRGW